MTGDVKVLGIVGMPGSGKSVAACVGKKLGFHIIVMGDIVREEAARKGLELTPENLGRIMSLMRKEEGPSVVAKRSIKKIAGFKKGKIIIDGIRSLSEVEEFKRHFPNFKLLSIHASPKTRFNRIFKRGRSDDSDKKQLFDERDMRELQVGIGSAIAMADHVIANEGSLAQFKESIKRFLEEYVLE